MTALSLWPTNLWSENLTGQLSEWGLRQLIAIGDEYFNVSVYFNLIDRANFADIVFAFCSCCISCCCYPCA